MSQWCLILYYNEESLAASGVFYFLAFPKSIWGLFVYMYIKYSRVIRNIYQIFNTTLDTAISKFST